MKWEMEDEEKEAVLRAQQVRKFQDNGTDSPCVVSHFETWNTGGGFARGPHEELKVLTNELNVKNEI